MNVSKRLDDLGFGSSILGLLPESEEAKILRFQRFHGLEETGLIDKATSRSLNAPRFCGCPDLMVMDATTKPRWPDPHIYWGFADNWPQPTMDKVRACLEWGMQQWSNVAKVSWEYCDNNWPQGARSKLLVYPKRLDGPFGVLAQSELANNSDGQHTQDYDTSERWATKVIANLPLSANDIDLALVAMHELGHFIGIPHISGGPCVMNPIYNPTLLTLQPGDVAEAVARYGAAVTPPPPTPTPNPTELVLRIRGNVDSLVVPPGLSVVRG